MKLWIAAAFAAFLLAESLPGSSAASSYEDGMRAVAAKDWDHALDLLETALAAEPDNLRYGSDYRQAVLQRAKALHPKEGRPEDFDRSIHFFEQLVAKNPACANAYLNYGFAYVDKIPAAGSITQVILANNSLNYFSKSLELRPSWIGYYTRGNSYLYWPRVFGKAKLGVADLEQAIKIQRSGPKKAYYVRVYVSLGDGYWKIDDLDHARAVWTEGLKEFPDSAALKERLSTQGDDLKQYIDDALDPSKRVDTDLKDLWSNP